MTNTANDNKCTVRYEMRMPLDERESMEVVASRLNISVAEYLRQLHKGQNLADLVSRNDNTKIQAKAVYELNRIGNNLNQIAHRLNTIDGHVPPETLEASLHELHNALEVVCDGFS